MTLKFIITAVGRSGTGYIHKLLKQNNIKIGHEKIFDIRGIHNRSDLIADSSTFALPYISELDDSVVIFHQFRHPYDVINSRVRCNLSDKKSRFVRSHKYSSKYIDIDMPNYDKYSLVLYQTEYWVKWNQEIKRRAKNHKYMTYAIENLDINIFSPCLGVNIKMKNISTRTNHKGNSKHDIKNIKKIIKSSKYFQEVKEISNNVGYIL